MNEWMDRIWDANNNLWFIDVFKAENEIQSLLRRNCVIEDERDQLENRLQTTLDKLQEASKVVDEFERFSFRHL